MHEAKLHQTSGAAVAEISGQGILISSPAEALQIMMDTAYSASNRIVLYQRNIAPEFFELRTGFAGEVLQKASNYGIMIAIAGEFSNITSESLKALIAESNRGKSSCFVGDLTSAIKALSKG